MNRKINIILFIVIFIVTGCNNKNDITSEIKTKVLEPEIEYSCRIGDVLNNNNQCVNRMITGALTRYSCPIGYNLYGMYCGRSDGIHNHSKCGIYAVEVNGICYNYINATLDYYCVTGYMEGNNCIYETMYNPNISYVCPDGYSLNSFNKCIR